MKTTRAVFRHQVRDVLRSRWAVAYALFFLVFTEGLLLFSGGGAQALLSLVNVVLVLVPLVTLVYGTMYLYQARDFVEMLLAQPASRRSVFTGLYFGLAVPLAGAFVLGVSLPFVWHSEAAPAGIATLATMAGIGAVLTFVFVGLACVLAFRYEDRVRGLGAALALWLCFSVVYDGLLLLGIYAFSNYPLEGPALIATLLNPVDLARVTLLLRFDVAAMMGYTGAVFEAFFGSAAGVAAAAAALSAWAVGPALAARRLFSRKDF